MAYHGSIPWDTRFGWWAPTITSCFYPIIAVAFPETCQVASEAVAALHRDHEISGSFATCYAHPRTAADIVLVSCTNLPGCWWELFDISHKKQYSNQNVMGWENREFLWQSALRILRQVVERCSVQQIYNTIWKSHEKAQEKWSTNWVFHTYVN